MSFPIPNDKHPDGIVVASVHYREDIDLATILVLRPEPPFFRVGVWDYVAHRWDGTEDNPYRFDHMNIVPAITGEALHDGEGHFTGKFRHGYTDLGGDY